MPTGSNCRPWIDGIVRGQPAAEMASAQDGLVAGVVAEAVIRSMYEGGRTVAVELPTVSATDS